MPKRQFYKFHDSFMDRSRALRTKYLAAAVTPLKKTGITANHLTFLSLISVLAAVWFLFDDNRYFILFGTLHLFFDLFDGVLARSTKNTLFGKYFDSFTDNLFIILMLVKTSFFLKSIFPGFIAVLYASHLWVFVSSRSRAPLVVPRTLMFILFLFQFYIIAPFVGAIIVLYSMLAQMRDYHFTFFKPKK